MPGLLSYKKFIASNGNSKSSNAIPEENRVLKIFISGNMKTIVKETSWTELFMLRLSVNKES
jgi:hypothetical protein